MGFLSTARGLIVFAPDGLYGQPAGSMLLRIARKAFPSANDVVRFVISTSSWPATFLFTHLVTYGCSEAWLIVAI